MRMDSVVKFVLEQMAKVSNCENAQIDAYV